MREFIIEGQRMTSKDAIYAQLNRLFSFPNHFGNNLDALWDVLTEETESTTIHFVDVDAMMQEMDEYGDMLYRFFQQLDARTDNYTVHFYAGEIEDIEA